MENKFSEKLKELRNEKQFTQQQLAKELSVQRYFISNLEQGRVEPDLGMLIKLAKFFEVTVDYLLGLED